jgi:hypothetical protein
MEMAVGSEANAINRFGARVVAFLQARHKLCKRRLSLSSNYVINEGMLQKMLRKECGMRSAHHRDDVSINLLDDSRYFQRLQGIGGVGSGNPDNRWHRVLNDLPGLLLRCPEAVEPAKQRKRRVNVIPIEGDQVLKRLRQGKRAFPACSEVNHGHVAQVLDLRRNIEEIQRIGPDGRVVEVFYRGLDEEYFHTFTVKEDLSTDYVSVFNSKEKARC